MPQNIQLALQGGGAKICDLMAAMDALEDLKQDLKVTRIAGTSAGALIGALFASGIKMREARAYLVGGAGDELASKFRFKKSDIAHLLFGRPLWNTRHEEEALAKLFASHGVQFVGDTADVSDIHLKIISSDLGDGGKVIHEGNSDIVTAISESCGLPFCFKVWNSGGGPVRVDGGVCENLPSNELIEGESEFGPVVAITFTRTRVGHPQSFKEFVLGLVDTAISNSVSRAQSVLPPASVYSISTEIKTFDFPGAISALRGAPYELGYLKARNWFEEFVERRKKGEEVVVGDPWTDPNPTATELLANAWSVYIAQHGSQRFKYHECVFEIEARGLAYAPGEEHADLDRVRYRLEFGPIESPIQCFSVALSVPPNQSYLGRTQWEVRNQEGQLIRSIPFPARNSECPNDRELIHFFDPVLPVNSGSYTLKYRDAAKGMMNDLLEKGKDEIMYTPRRAVGSIDRVILVLHVPSKWKLEIQNKAGNPNGRLLNDQEIGKMNLDSPDGFRPIGWIGFDVNGTTPYGVDIVRH